MSRVSCTTPCVPVLARFRRAGAEEVVGPPEEAEGVAEIVVAVPFSCDLFGCYYPPAEPNCAVFAVKSVIAHGEGTDLPGLKYGGYGTVAAGTVVGVSQDNLDLLGNTYSAASPAEIDPSAVSGHPFILVRVNPSLQSSAYGRYQITSGTAASRGFGDFSPMGQEAAATQLMQIRHMLDPLLRGDPMQAILNGNREWASLPESPYGQPTMTRATAMSVYQHSYGACIAGFP